MDIWIDLELRDWQLCETCGLTRERLDEALEMERIFYDPDVQEQIRLSEAGFAAGNYTMIEGSVQRNYRNHVEVAVGRWP